MKPKAKRHANDEKMVHDNTTMYVSERNNEKLTLAMQKRRKGRVGVCVCVLWARLTWR